MRPRKITEPYDSLGTILKTINVSLCAAMTRTDTPLRTPVLSSSCKNLNRIQMVRCMHHGCCHETWRRVHAFKSKPS